MKLYIKSSSTTIPATEIYQSLPANLKHTIKKFSYYIGVERCGNTSDLDSAKEYIMQRTVDNPKSKLSKGYNYYDEAGDYRVDSRETSINDIDELFAYCKNNNITVDQLCKMGRMVRRYS